MRGTDRVFAPRHKRRRGRGCAGAIRERLMGWPSPPCALCSSPLCPRRSPTAPPPHRNDHCTPQGAAECIHPAQREGDGGVNGRRRREHDNKQGTVMSTTRYELGRRCLGVSRSDTTQVCAHWRVLRLYVRAGLQQRLRHLKLAIVCRRVQRSSPALRRKWDRGGRGVSATRRKDTTEEQRVLRSTHYAECCAECPIWMPPDRTDTDRRH